MNPRTALLGALSSLLMFAGSAVAQDLELIGPDQNPAPSALAVEPGAADADTEVLTRGPIHEAFAEPITFDAQGSVTVATRPPDPIEEIPPEVKPEGNAIWASGYWAWDDEQNDFIWVSGAWRVMPVGQRWVPGYWAEVQDGHQYVSGFWTGDEEEQIAYLPPPPETQEAGPNSPSPSENHFWVPGTWRYAEADYAWSPGYWARMQPNWVWVPARYVWTPVGFVFTAGYWDHPLVRRGWLFAPVRFRGDVYARPGFFYTPSVVLNTGVLSLQLFTRPRYSAYYFGDYYDARYTSAGYVPWYEWGRRGYDPIFTYQRWYYGRRDPNWLGGIEQQYALRRSDRGARPPRVFVQANANTNQTNIAFNLNQFVSQEAVRDRGVQRLDRSERQQFNRVSREFRNLQNERSQLEVGRAGVATRSRDNRQERVTLRLPTVDRSTQFQERLDRAGRAGGDLPNRLGDGQGVSRESQDARLERQRRRMDTDRDGSDRQRAGRTFDGERRQFDAGDRAITGADDRAGQMRRQQLQEQQRIQRQRVGLERERQQRAARSGDIDRARQTDDIQEQQRRRSGDAERARNELRENRARAQQIDRPFDRNVERSRSQIERRGGSSDRARIQADRAVQGADRSRIRGLEGGQGRSTAGARDADRANRARSSGEQGQRSRGTPPAEMRSRGESDDNPGGRRSRQRAAFDAQGGNRRQLTQSETFTPNRTRTGQNDDRAQRMRSRSNPRTTQGGDRAAANVTESTGNARLRSERSNSVRRGGARDDNDRSRGSNEAAP